jgi:hypothetical protein
VGGSKDNDWHTMGKALSEKPISVEGIQQTLDMIWCSDCGMVCKEMGDNFFLFHFNHLASENRTWEDGLWMVGHSMLVWW